MKLKMLSVVIVLLALGACSSGSSDGQLIPVASYDVLTESGVKMSLDGLWIRPCELGGQQGDPDALTTHDFSGSSLIVTSYSYTSSDGSCTGTQTTDSLIEATFTAGSVTAITGWVDFDGNLANPPLAQDGSGPLSNTESVTSLTFTVVSAVPADPELPPGKTVPMFYVVDDTIVDAPVMYGKSNFGETAEIDLPLTRQQNRTYTLFNMEIASPGTDLLLSLNGSDTDGNSFTGSLSFTDQGQTTYNSTIVVQTDVLISVTLIGGATITELITNYGDPGTRALLTYIDSIKTCTATVVSALPTTALLGEFGSLGTRTCTDGTTEAASWRLEISTDRNARLIFSFEREQFGDSADSEEITFIIDPNGNVISFQAIISEPSGYALTLNSI